MAEIHTGILKSDLFRTYDELYPGKIVNVTNGVTQRRWLGLANPLLADFITKRIGDGWLTDLEQLAELRRFEDADSVTMLGHIKRANKERLARVLKDHAGLALDPDSMLDVQIKRLHEYKRQLMNALSLLTLYHGIKDGGVGGLAPTTYLFGAKAAGSYFRAKGVIKLIHEVGRLIAADPEASRLMGVVFVPDYNVSWAEHIVAAAEVSEQISLAGTEASGTGNMKAGAEWRGDARHDGTARRWRSLRRAGAENNYIFGLSVSEATALRGRYDSCQALCDPRIRRAVDALTGRYALRRRHGALCGPAPCASRGERPLHGAGRFACLYRSKARDLARLCRPACLWPERAAQHRGRGLLLQRPRGGGIRTGHLAHRKGVTWNSSAEAGILMHITSLPSPHGIGTLGAAAFRFADFLVEAGQRYWQVLPLGMTGYGNSPYQSCSAFAGNINLIDLDILAQQGTLQPADYRNIDWGSRSDCVDFGKIYAHRSRVLGKGHDCV